MPIAQGGASCANCWSARNCVVGLSVSDPLTVAQALVPELDAQSDLLIVLSQAFPFRNMLVTGVLTGAALQAALDHSAALDPADNPGGFPTGAQGLRPRWRCPAGWLRPARPECAGPGDCTLRRCGSARR